VKSKRSLTTSYAFAADSLRDWRLVRIASFTAARASG
jgi:hypothetical protein